MDLDEKTYDETRHFHLAGIVPIGGQRLDFNMPWHDCLMPLAPDYTLIHHAILECAWAGCETIWVLRWCRVQPRVYFLIPTLEHRRVLEKAIHLFEETKWCAGGHFTVQKI